MGLFYHISLRSTLVYILENRHVTFDPNYLNLPKNEPLKGNSGVNLQSPTNFGESRPKDTRGVGEQTDRQTNKYCSNDLWPQLPWPSRNWTPQGQFWGQPTFTHQFWWRPTKERRKSRGTNRQTDKQKDTNIAQIIVWLLSGKSFIYCMLCLICLAIYH